MPSKHLDSVFKIKTRAGKQDLLQKLYILCGCFAGLVLGSCAAKRAPLSEESFKQHLRQRDHYRRNMKCYRDAHALDQTLQGELRYNFVIRKNGRVRRLETLANDFEGSEVEACVRQNYEALVFPKSSKVSRYEYGSSFHYEPDEPSTPTLPEKAPAKPAEDDSEVSIDQKAGDQN